MSRRDALATLLALRRRALDAATLELAARLATQAAADAAVARSSAALRAEAACAGGQAGTPAQGSDYAAWLPRGQAEAAEADRAARQAAQLAEAARDHLRQARTELELAGKLAARRAAAERARLLHREQAALDEVAGILHATR